MPPFPPLAVGHNPRRMLKIENANEHPLRQERRDRTTGVRCRIPRILFGAGFLVHDERNKLEDVSVDSLIPPIPPIPPIPTAQSNRCRFATRFRPRQLRISLQTMAPSCGSRGLCCEMANPWRPRACPNIKRTSNARRNA
jgi:hypothetical protein